MQTNTFVFSRTGAAISPALIQLRQTLYLRQVSILVTVKCNAVF